MYWPDRSRFVGTVSFRSIRQFSFRIRSFWQGSVPPTQMRPPGMVSPAMVTDMPRGIHSPWARGAIPGYQAGRVAGGSVIGRMTSGMALGLGSSAIGGGSTAGSGSRTIDVPRSRITSPTAWLCAAIRSDSDGSGGAGSVEARRRPSGSGAMIGISFDRGASTGCWCTGTIFRR